MNITGFEQLSICLARVAERERFRAHAEFRVLHGREYDGGSDLDWDLLDKDHVGVEEAMNILRAGSTMMVG